MRHAREDYNEAIKDVRMLSGAFITTVTFPVVRGTPIPDDEPVFLLRAQDPFAAEAVAMYANKLAAHARNDADLAFARLATRHADLMAAWPHKKDYPDTPGVNAPVIAAPVIDMTPEERRGTVRLVRRIAWSGAPDGDGVHERAHEDVSVPGSRANKPGRRKTDAFAAPEDNPADDVQEPNPNPEIPADPDAPTTPATSEGEEQAQP